MADPGAVLEIGRICGLAEELQSPGCALGFLADFLDMLPGRVDRILRGLDERDTDRTIDAVLSLKITSSMVGALDTETRCRAIETLVREGRIEAARRAGRRLHGAVEALHAAAPDLLLDARMAMDHHAILRRT